MKILYIILTIIFVHTSCLAQRFYQNVYIKGDGVMEVGKYFDFHETDTHTGDFNIGFTVITVS